MLRPLASQLTFGPDGIEQTRTDRYVPGLPLTLPVPVLGIANQIQPFQNLDGRMPGNSWFPYLVASAPFDALPPGPTRPNVMSQMGGGSTRWSGTAIRAWLKANLLGNAG